jgi:parvulin-like peptidyl-prolyl isomerase
LILHHRHRISTQLTFALWAILTPLFVTAQTPADGPKDPTRVCAKVDDITIRFADIERERKRRIEVKSIGEAELAIVDARIREQLIERHLALAALQRTGKAASRADVDFELARWKEELKTQGITLEAHLAKEHLTESELRREITWRLSWSRYLAEFLTEANLEKYFKDHQADYDGRKLRVAQILLKLPKSSSPKDRQAVIEKATKLREEIIAGKQKFADAAKANSQSPSAADGGWIERREPMGEEFSKAAFALKVDETSPPVITAFGVHLIHCQEVEAGKKTWRDVRRDLERDVSAYLGRWLADSQRDKSKVERTDALPIVDSPAAVPASPSATSSSATVPEK